MRVSTPNLFSTKTEMVCLILRLDSPSDLLLRAPNLPAKSKTRVPQFLHTGTAGDLRATLTRSTRPRQSTTTTRAASTTAKSFIGADSSEPDDEVQRDFVAKEGLLKEIGVLTGNIRKLWKLRGFDGNEKN